VSKSEEGWGVRYPATAAGVAGRAGGRLSWLAHDGGRGDGITTIN
jgi:hypothetical protein